MAILATKYVKKRKQMLKDMKELVYERQLLNNNIRKLKKEMHKECSDFQ